MLQGIIKILLYILLIYLIALLYRFFKTLIKARRTHKISNPLSGMMVKDEYCNTYLPKEDAIREVINDKEYFFCSNECYKKFLNQSK